MPGKDIRNHIIVYQQKYATIWELAKILRQYINMERNTL